MNSDIAQALLLFALVLGGLGAFFALLVNLQYQVHRRRRLRLREMAHVLGLEYVDHTGDLEEASPSFGRRFRNRAAAWSIRGRYRERDILIRPAAPEESEGNAAYFSMQAPSGQWAGLYRPRTPMHDEEIEVVLEQLLETAGALSGPEKN